MQCDIAIVGGGLAGSVLAWTLRERRLRVLLLDRGAADSASRVAAGLVTPVTGRRLIPTWRWGDFFPQAEQRYRQIEQQTGLRCWSPRPALRRLTTPDELAAWRGLAHTSPLLKLADPPWQTPALELPPTSWVPPQTDDSAQGAEPSSIDVEFPHAARLDIPALIGAVHQTLAQEHSLVSGVEVYPQEVHLTPDGVSLLGGTVQAAKLVFCEGIGAMHSNPFFAGLQFLPAQGDILRVSLPGWRENRVVHWSGRWLAPVGTETHQPQALLGSTYRWDHDDVGPSAAGREALLSDLERIYAGIPHVIEHRAGVRPATFDQHPFVGIHPTHPQLAILNGLGAKGALMAPGLANSLADQLLQGSPPEPATSLTRPGAWK